MQKQYELEIQEKIIFDKLLRLPREVHLNQVSNKIESKKEEISNKRIALLKAIESLDAETLNKLSIAWNIHSPKIYMYLSYNALNNIFKDKYKYKVIKDLIRELKRLEHELCVLIDEKEQVKLSLCDASHILFSRSGYCYCPKCLHTISNHNMIDRKGRVIIKLETPNIKGFFKRDLVLSREYLHHINPGNNPYNATHQSGYTERFLEAVNEELLNGKDVYQIRKTLAKKFRWTIFDSWRLMKENEEYAKNLKEEKVRTKTTIK
jgi:hypothetical protein